MENIRVVAGTPSVEDYRSLTEAVGWTRYKNLNVAETALKNSLTCVVALDGEKVVGTGRIVGDGAIFFYLQDIMVYPEYQRRGIGTAIMDALMEWLDKNAPAKAYISLFTGKAKAGFYTPYGFQGPEEFLYGMAMKKRASKPLRRKTSRSDAPTLPADNDTPAT